MSVPPRSIRQPRAKYHSVLPLNEDASRPSLTRVSAKDARVVDPRLFATSAPGMFFARRQRYGAQGRKADVVCVCVHVVFFLCRGLLYLGSRTRLIQT
jgi:hypothetical protein